MLKILGIGILSIIFVFIFSLALAQESSPIAPTNAPSPVAYSLPYPGILPDHPLYFLKTVRDFILSKLISSPVKKVEFDLLQADKKLNMSIFLKMKAKNDLMQKINAESVKHLRDADSHLFAMSVANFPEANGLKDKFEQSLKKHIEEFNNLKNGLGVQDQASLNKFVAETETVLTDFYRKR